MSITNKTILNLEHSHVFNEGNPLAERNTKWAVFLTSLMMIGEIFGGWFYNSMALLAVGWHMSSHVLALGLSVFAYRAARRLTHDKRFAFGTWKIEIMSGYTSAIFLIGVAGLMLYQSAQRLIVPMAIPSRKVKWKAGDRSEQSWISSGSMVPRINAWFC